MSYSSPIGKFTVIVGACAALATLTRAGDGGVRLDLAGGSLTAGDGAPALEGLRSDDPPSGLPISSGNRFYIRAAGWYTFLQGDLGYGTSVNGAPVDLDLDNILNYDTDVLTLRGEFGFTFNERFHVDAAINGPFNYDGQTTQSISFGDFTYAADTVSELDFITLEGTFSYDVVKEDRFRLWLGAGLRAVALHFEATGQAIDSNGNLVGTRTDDLDAGAAIPVVGLGLRWDFHRNFYVAGRAMGLYVGDYGNAYDLSAELGWDFTRNIGIFAGYKFSHFEASEIEVDDVDLDIDGDLHGPFAGIEFRF